MTVLRRALFALLAVLVSSSVSAQTVTRAIAWDPSADESRVLEYHVFRDNVYAGPITVPNRTFAFTITPGASATFVVYSYGWLKNADGTLSTEAGVGAPSAPFTWQEPAAPPPSLPPLLLAPPPNQTIVSSTSPVAVTFPDPVPSGGVPPYSLSCTPPSGSLFWVGVTIVPCAVYDSGGQITRTSFTVTVTLGQIPPPMPTDTAAPSVSAHVRREGNSHNYTVTITATDNVGVTQIVLMQGSGVRAACSGSTCVVPLSLKPKGTYVYEAQAWDAAENMGAATVTIRR